MKTIFFGGKIERIYFSFRTHSDVFEHFENDETVTDSYHTSEIAHTH